VDDPAAHVDEIVAGLVAAPMPPAEVLSEAPVVVGLYAWWARP
jgi:hypothetical protein